MRIIRWGFEIPQPLSNVTGGHSRNTFSLIFLRETDDNFFLRRFMQRDLPNLTRNRLQLAGVAAMLIASKYEEIYAPEVTSLLFKY